MIIVSKRVVKIKKLAHHNAVTRCLPGSPPPSLSFLRCYFVTLTCNCKDDIDYDHALIIGTQRSRMRNVLYGILEVRLGFLTRET